MEGSESEVREVHETSMVLSDAVLIYYGKCTEHWVYAAPRSNEGARMGQKRSYLAPSLWVGAPRRHTRRSCTSRRLRC